MDNYPLVRKAMFIGRVKINKILKEITLEHIDIKDFDIRIDSRAVVLFFDFLVNEDKQKELDLIANILREKLNTKVCLTLEYIEVFRQK